MGGKHAACTLREQEGRAAMAAMAARDAQQRAAAAAKNELEAYIIATADALGGDALTQASVVLSFLCLVALPVRLFSGNFLLHALLLACWGLAHAHPSERKILLVESLLHAG
jgi:hypothetical protein